MSSACERSLSAGAYTAISGHMGPSLLIARITCSAAAASSEIHERAKLVVGLLETIEVIRPIHSFMNLLIVATGRSLQPELQ
jgi:hypothetical protein